VVLPDRLQLVGFERYELRVATLGGDGDLAAAGCGAAAGGDENAAVVADDLGERAVGEHLDADAAVDRCQRRLVELELGGIVGDRAAGEVELDDLGVARFDLEADVEQVAGDRQLERFAVGERSGTGPVAVVAQVFDLAESIRTQPIWIRRPSGTFSKVCEA
jgi:hypothetical protein